PAFGRLSPGAMPLASFSGSWLKTMKHLFRQILNALATEVMYASWLPAAMSLHVMKAPGVVGESIRWQRQSMNGVRPPVAKVFIAALGIVGVPPKPASL